MPPMGGPTVSRRQKALGSGGYAPAPLPGALLEKNMKDFIYNFIRVLPLLVVLSLIFLAAAECARALNGMTGL